ncbi:MAG: TIGR03085 family protein [Actinobacteria bacterium]|nr:TIGR03085 family protein [Actinomycetota bacterium]
MSYSRDERLALCALLEETGPDAPTLCEGWTTGDLAAHLVLRERRPDAAAGVLGGPLAGYTARVQRRIRARTSFPELVQAVRSGPPRLSVLALPGVDDLANAVEFFVHHEDVRRAVPGWEPRELSSGESGMLWHRLRRARFMLRKAPVGVELARDDIGAGGNDQAYRITARNATPAVTVIGSPAELTMWVMGRTSAARVRMDGTRAAVTKLAGANVRLAAHLPLEPGQLVVHVRSGIPGRLRRGHRLDVGPGQRPAVAGLADLALGLLAGDLPAGPGHLDGHGDRADHQRRDHQRGHGVNDETDHRADDQERDQYAGRDGDDLEPAHPPHPPLTQESSVEILPDFAPPRRRSEPGILRGAAGIL